MFGKKTKIDLSKLNSIIAKGIQISGTVEFTGTMKVSGFVDGVIKCPEEQEVGKTDNILIVEGTVLSPSIIADHIVITGVVKAENVTATKSLVVIAGGQLVAERVKYGSLTIDDSAMVSGNLSKITASGDGK